MAIKKIQAVAYLRTSSAANVADEKNPDRDSDKRQRAAIAAYAKRAGVQIVDEYYDEAVSGADHIDTRPGFKAMLERLLSNGVRTIVVETANRFARDLMVQEVGFAMLKERGITLIAADSPDAFLDDTPTSRLIRQVLGSVPSLEVLAQSASTLQRDNPAQPDAAGGVAYEPLPQQAGAEGAEGNRARIRSQVARHPD